MKVGFGWKVFTCVCLLAGAVLRLSWVGDVEYKDDEDQLFRYSQAVPATGLWPAIGTTSGVREIRHPALGIWSFAILGQVLHVDAPLTLTRGVQGLSLIALALLFWFAWRVVPDAQREIWLWTAALASVNLVAVVYARKIWIPSLLSIFCVVILIAWSYRHVPVGALTWGIAGALIGQAHMSGFFYSAAVLAVTALFARKSVRWRAWFIGSAWGAIPLLPWLSYMWINDPAPPAAGPTVPASQLSLDFLRMAFEISLGQTAEFNVGNHFPEYLAYPVLYGFPTHAVEVTRQVLRILGMVALVAGAAATIRHLGRLARDRRLSDIHLCLLSVVLTGVALSLAGVLNSPHHHLMVFPIEYLWVPLAVMAGLPKPRIWLSAVWLGSAVCTMAFLQFVHDHCGAPNGDYGVAYRCAAKTRSPDLEALIRAGQEDVVARMLGRGEVLPPSCRLTEGQIDRTLVRATYTCGDDRVGVELVHASKAPDGALRTKDFAAVIVEGSPPAGFVEAIVQRVRTEEPGFQWLLEAGRQTSRNVTDVGPYGYYLPVLTSREVLLRMVGGAVLVLLTWPWWGARPSFASSTALRDTVRSGATPAPPRAS